MLEADQVVDECADILMWLHAACTARGGAGDLAGLPAVAYSFPLMLMPVTVSDYVTTKVAADRSRGLTPWQLRSSSWRPMSAS